MLDPQRFNDLYLLALAIYRESRSEPLDGKLAVGSVIKNRVAGHRWPNSYRDVVLQPYQFSAFNKSDPQVTVYPRGVADSAWGECVDAAMKVMYGDVDYARGANHYFADTIQPPHWADPEKFVMKIGRHSFYKL